MDVDQDGNLGDPFDLGKSDYDEWGKAKDNILDIKDAETTKDDQDVSGDDPLQDLLGEADDSLKDDYFEGLRHEDEEPPEPPREPPGDDYGERLEQW